MHRYSPTDPRYHDRFQAAVELLRMWNLAAEELASTGAERRFYIRNDAAFAKLVEWTGEFLKHPSTPPSG